MRTILFFSIFLLALSGCDNDLHLISLDYSVSLKAIESGLDTAEIGRPVKCVLTLSGLDEENTSELITTFRAAGDGVIRIDDIEYKAGDAISYDYRENPKLSFDFIPMAEGKQVLTLSVASEDITRSDSVKFNILNREMKIDFVDVPNYVNIDVPAVFRLMIETTQKDITGQARFITGGGQLFISGRDAQNNDVPLNEGENIVVFMCTQSGTNVIEFTVTSRYGFPTKKQLIIRVLSK